MFKLVVLCSIVAAALAKPGGFLAPIGYSSAVLSPATTTITHQASSVVHPSPAVYPAPLTYASPLAYTHFIKKRSAPFALNTYYGPTAYAATTPLLTSYHGSHIVPSLPLVHSSPYVYSSAHLIKKRSAPFAYSNYGYIPTTYAAAPFVASTYATAPIVHSAPLYTHPITYSTHLIKKRSAPLAFSTYFAPTSISHQSRIDYHTSPHVTTYTSPIAYPSPFAYSHYF